MQKDRQNKVRNVQLLHFRMGWRRIVTTKYGMCNCCILGRDGEGSSQQSTECAIAAFLDGMEKDRHNKVRNVQLLHFRTEWIRIVTTKYGMCNCCILGGMEKDRHNKVRNVKFLLFRTEWIRIVTTKYGMCNCCILGGMEKDRHNKVRNDKFLLF